MARHEKWRDYFW